MLFLLTAPVVCLAASVNTPYTHVISTFAATNAFAAADINLAAVKVKSIDVTNTTATAQTITLYTLANVTNTISAVYTFAVPAAIGTYSIPLFDGKPTVWSSSADVIDVQYFAARTSVDANAATINVKYWK